jgi:hypothetical protein
MLNITIARETHEKHKKIDKSFVGSRGGFSKEPLAAGGKEV